MKIDWQRFLPKYWLQNHSTDWEWDRVLNELIDTFDPILGHKTITFGTTEVWISNWPYAYGFSSNPSYEKLPSVATRKRLRGVEKSLRLSGIRSSIREKREIMWNSK